MKNCHPKIYEDLSEPAIKKAVRHKSSKAALTNKSVRRHSGSRA
jgi:hypothetical protein